MYTSQVLFLGTFALGSYAQFSSSSGGALGGFSSTTAPPVAAQTTVNLFLDADSDEQFVGSVVSADSCETTYALVCTRGDYGSASYSTTCDPNQTGYYTYSSGYFGVSTQSSAGGAEVTVVESCSLDGTTKAVCVASISASADGHHTATQRTVTKTGTDVRYSNVPITGGASMLSGLAKCTQSQGAASAPTGAVDVYKVLVAPGAAAVLAGINAFV